MQNNLIEYEDPVLYDLENASFDPDGSFYLTLARQVGQPVLEIECGTGRITIPMAQQGIQMTGIDVVPAMLNHARSKASGLSIRWVEVDARTFHLEQKFRLIFESGSAFQHLLERSDQEAMLARVREHLALDGRFVVSSIFPIAELLEPVEDEQDWFSYPNELGQEVKVSGTQHYDALSQIKTETAYRRWKDAEGQEIVKIAPLKLRYFYPQEMEALLHYNGFKIVERYGQVDFSPLTATSERMIYVCQI
ncbi:MAG: class I SAM-dependent methyltransferase [Anaerolineae bacterium]|nr:class I SAM-dependent methyltransferase [Anaerolineae bacterium]